MKLITKLFSADSETNCAFIGKKQIVMIETKIFLTDEENELLIKTAKDAGQSKVMYCTTQIRMLLKKAKRAGKNI